MTPDKAFELFPKVTEVFTVGSETFLTEQEANDYSTHFNLGKATKVERPVVEDDKAKGTEAKGKKAAADKAAADKEAADKEAADKAAADKEAADKAAAEAK